MCPNLFGPCEMATIVFHSARPTHGHTDPLNWVLQEADGLHVYQNVEDEGGIPPKVRTGRGWAGLGGAFLGGAGRGWAGLGCTSIRTWRTREESRPRYVLGGAGRGWAGLDGAGRGWTGLGEKYGWRGNWESRGHWWSQ